ncbi:MAG: cupredoxin domain-containing protein [Candidatus Elarobacter sp.]
MRTLLVAALLAAGIPTSVQASPAPAAPQAIVHIRDDAFVPAMLTVRAGTSVTFVNDDDDAHTATADDESWDSEGLNQAQRWTHAFTKAGKVTYHCTVHPMMHGTIVVRAAQ